MRRHNHQFNLAHERLETASKLICSYMRGMGLKLHPSKPDVPVADEVFDHLSDLANLAIDDMDAQQQQHPRADIRGMASDDVFTVDAWIGPVNDEVVVEVTMRVV